MHEQNTIYIVLTYTGTMLSKIIKIYTGAEYSHVSLALDSNLDEMYSFGRLNPYNPFIGGFVKEGINKGTFNRFPKTKSSIYSLSVSQKQYEKIKKLVYNIKENRDNYRFNIIGLFANGLHIKYQRKNSFYCAEFIKYILDNCYLDLDLPELVKPNDFKKVKKLSLVYKGKLNEYNKSNL